MGRCLQRMEAYLAQLPKGLLSYPNHLQRATVYHSLIEGLPVSRLVPLLPRQLANRVVHPPSATAWLPEVEATAIYLAMLDELLGGDEERILAHAYRSCQSFLDSPAHRILFRLAGAERVAQGLAARWGNFHQGIGLTTSRALVGKGLTVRLDFPQGMVPLVVGRGHLVAISVAIELAGGREVDTSLSSWEETSQSFSCTWR